MITTLDRPADVRRIWPVLAVWAAAVVLSTAQIYLREIARGFSTPWPEVLWANILAWSPWLPIVALALWSERRFPLTGESRGRHAIFHTVVAAAVSATFLLYLTMFHWVYLGGRAVAGSLPEIRVAFLRKLDQFFLTAALLYGTILLAGLALRRFREQRRVQPAARVEPPALVIRSIGRVEQVSPSSVHWIESCGNYARLHLDGRSPLIRRTLASLATELEPSGFARVHRSAIVNLERIVELRRLSHGEAMLVLQGGHELKASRTYRRALERLRGFRG